MGLERLAPLPGDGEEGEPSSLSRTAKPAAPSAEGRGVSAETPPPFGVSAEAFLAERGLTPRPAMNVGSTAPERGGNDIHGAEREVGDAAVARPAELEEFDQPASRGRAARGKRGRSPKTWPTREERDERAEAKRLAQAAEVAADPVGVARDICLRLLEFGPRTRQELALALAKRQVPEEAAEQVLGRFAEVGIIDDALFASMWVTSRHRGRGLAGRALSQELRRKGVDDEIVRAAVDELDPETEVETARTLVRRKLPSTRGLAPEARIRRLAGMLARKGYGAGTAFRVVKEELEREGTDPPELSFDALQSLDD